MRTLAQIIACIAVALAACSGAPDHSPKDGPDKAVENCSVLGDENGNGLADCSDPACATAPSCQHACGNGRLDPDRRLASAVASAEAFRAITRSSARCIALLRAMRLPTH